MTEELLKCAYDKCKNKFVKTTHNQKYCSDECCRIATNKKLKKQYYDRKARLAGKEFKCSSRGCDQILNRYTTDKICEVCQAKKVSKERKDLLDMLKRSGII